MKKLLSNWEIKVLAVLAAVIFWFLVVATENTFYTFPGQVPVKAFNVPENLVVVEDLGNVSLRLKINNREAIKNLSVDDFSAFVDLEGAVVGEREVEIEVTSKKSDVSVAKVEPAKVKVIIEERAEKEVPIEYIIEQEPKQGFRVSDVNISEDKLLIKGPEKLLNEVETASLILNLDGFYDNKTAIFPVKVFDSDGNVIDEITTDKTELEAEIKISAITDQKVVGVKPTIIGEPNENIWIKSIIIEPNYVVLTGDKSVIDKVEFVSTSDINVSGLSENATYDAEISGLPDGVGLEGNDSSVRIKIEVESYSNIATDAKRKTFKLPILVRKFNTNQRGISISPVTVTLVAEGDEEVLKDIDSKLKIEVDITGYEDHLAVVEINESNINLPDGVKLVSVTPSKVNINWED